MALLKQFLEEPLNRLQIYCFFLNYARKKRTKICVCKKKAVPLYDFSQKRLMRTEKELEGVTLLGNQQVQYSDQYHPDVLETFPNKHPENEYVVTFDCPEFTTLCPKTGQPDFGHLYISYIPRERMVESKSLKLYLFSFRNHGDFHEDCVNIIMKDLVRLMDPKYLEVTGYFMPRGGISIYPFANYADKDHEELKKQRLFEQFGKMKGEK